MALSRWNTSLCKGDGSMTTNMHKSEADRRGIKYVYCGRGRGGKIPDKIGETGWLGNPIPVGSICPLCRKVHNTNEEVLPCYTNYLWRKIQDHTWAKAFYDTCYDQVLVCFCKPKACHTDVMIRALEWLDQNKLW